mmetsp:Transcript_16353/g.39212  ORF Transcript_16353/g.39212 Transcript_16353/m.39212 type:complete len:225 (+) Transcript_16353:67-741(+)
MAARQVLLILAAAFIVLVAADDGEFEDGDVGSSATTYGSGTANVQGFFPNAKFLSMQKGKMLQVLLDGGQWKTPVRIDGSFTLYDVPEGSHLLEVAAPGWAFETLRIDVVRKGSSTKVKAYFASEMLAGRPVAYPLRLEASGITKYYEEREKFNPASYLKNPMVLMMIFVGVMAFVMPKVVENLDPEEMARYKEEKKKSGGSTMGALKAMTSDPAPASQARVRD